MSGDHTKKEVVFPEGTLWRITGRPVRFRFTLDNCTLYSFWMSASRSGASGGYLAGGGGDYARLRDMAPIYEENIDAIDVLAGGGDAFRGAWVPQGNLQLVPRTIDGDGKTTAYDYAHRTIEGFALELGKGSYLQVMPLVGEQVREGKWRSRFSHDREKAEAGYYMVDLLSSGIRAEMAALGRLPSKAEILNNGVRLKPVVDTLPGSFFAGRGNTLRLIGVPVDKLGGESVVVRVDFDGEAIAMISLEESKEKILSRLRDGN